jgi:hypothetical protein
LNVLKSHLRVTIQALLRNGTSQREIERLTGVDRKTIRRYGQEILGPPLTSSGVATGSDPGKTAISSVEIPPRPPARSPKEVRSACEVHREWIEAQVELGRNAVSIYQDLVEMHGFTHRYNSVKRFVRTPLLKPTAETGGEHHLSTQIPAAVPLLTQRLRKGMQVRRDGTVWSAPSACIARPRAR